MRRHGHAVSRGWPGSRNRRGPAPDTARLFAPGFGGDHLCATRRVRARAVGKAARYGIPTTIETGIPGALTRPVRAALALCGWIEGGFPAVRLARMFESGLLSTGEAAELSSSGAARLLRQSGATAGRGSYSAALVSLAAVAEERSKDPDRDDDLRESDRQRAARARTSRRGFQPYWRLFREWRQMAPYCWAT